jgi:hypothetical protein
MFNSKKPAEAKAKPTQPIAGRERLHFFDAELAKAHSAVSDLEKRVATLENIGVEAVAADKALQLFIGADGGVAALAAHSAGETGPDDQISKLLGAAKATSEAAGPAKVALPLAIDALEKCRAEVVRLEHERSSEVGRVMVQLVDNTAAKYKRAFETVCRLHDELAGFAAGSSSNAGEVLLISEEIKVPRFNLPSLASLGDYDVFMRRRANAFTVDQSAKAWAQVRERLESNVDADLSDLIPN